MATATGTTKSTRKPAAKKKAVVKKAPVKFVPPETVEGSWEDTIVRSAVLKSRGENASAKAGELLWAGAQEGINSWLPESDDDASAENLYQTLLLLMGKARKGDASKISKVAVAVKDKGLTLATYTSLSKAYAAARALIDAGPEEERQDAAAESLAATIAESAPKSSSTPEGAVKILLGQGTEEFARLIVAEVVDSAGSYEKAEPVLRALARSFSQEIAGKKPKPEPKPKAPATPKGEAVKKAVAKPASEKAKPAPAKAKAKPAPITTDEIDEIEVRGDDSDFPEGEYDEVDEGDAVDDDLLAEIEGEDEPEVAVEEPVKAKAKPVVRRR